MNIAIRTAWPTDDLTHLWPVLGKAKLNLGQIWVAVNLEEHDALLGGLLIFDGGHEIIYVGEFTLVSPTHRRLIAKRLVANVLMWASRMGKTMLHFHSVDPGFVSIVVRLGAIALGPTQGLVLPLRRSTTEK